MGDVGADFAELAQWMRVFCRFSHFEIGVEVLKTTDLERQGVLKRLSVEAGGVILKTLLRDVGKNSP